MESVGYVLGVLCGLLFGIFLVILIRRINRQKSGLRGCYDERQKIAQGMAYKTAYFVLLLYIGVVLLLAEAKITEIFLSFAGLWLGVCISIAVFVVICIWKDAYISLNENSRIFLMTFGTLGLMNFVGVIHMISEHEPFIVDGKLTTSCLNLITFIMLAVIMAAFCIKSKYNKRCEEEEEVEDI